VGVSKGQLKKSTEIPEVESSGKGKKGGKQCSGAFRTRGGGGKEKKKGATERATFKSQNTLDLVE